MKTRTGFVSNSSTSSFVLVGFDASGLVSLDYYNRDDIDCIYDGAGAPDGITTVVGRFVSNISSDGGWPDTTSRPIKDILEEVEEIRRKLGPSVKDSPIKIYSGVRPT